MKKVLEYRNFKINISVELGGSPVNRGNKPEHLVTVNDKGATNYYEKYIIKSYENLEDSLMSIEDKTKKDIDLLIDDPKSEEQKILESLGYS